MFDSFSLKALHLKDLATGLSAACVALSPDGSVVATSKGGGCSVRVFKTETGELLQVLKHHKRFVTALAITQDGKTLVSASLDADSAACAWSLAAAPGEQPSTGPTKVFADKKAHTDGVLALAVSADGRLLATGGRDRLVCVWRLDEGRFVQPLAAHSGAVRCLAFSADGKALVSGGDDGALVVWRQNSGGGWTQEKHIAAHAGAAFSVAVSQDGKFAFSAGADKAVRKWGLSGAAVAKAEGHTDAVLSIAVSRDGLKLFSSSRDKTVREWEIPEGSLIGLDTLKRAVSGGMEEWKLVNTRLKTDAATSLSLSKSGDLLAEAEAGGQVVLTWRAARNGVAQRVIPVSNAQEAPAAAASTAPPPQPAPAAPAPAPPAPASPAPSTPVAPAPAVDASPKEGPAAAVLAQPESPSAAAGAAAAALGAAKQLMDSGSAKLMAVKDDVFGLGAKFKGMLRRDSAPDKAAEPQPQPQLQPEAGDKKAAAEVEAKASETAKEQPEAEAKPAAAEAKPAAAEAKPAAAEAMPAAAEAMPAAAEAKPAAAEAKPAAAEAKPAAAEANPATAEAALVPTHGLPAAAAAAKSNGVGAPPLAVASDGKRWDVFVSYAHVDAAIVFQYAKALEAAGFSVWIDRELKTGQRWMAKIGDAMGICRAFLLFLSPAYVASKNCDDELQYAHHQLRLPKFPVWIADPKTVVLPTDYRMMMASVNWLQQQDGEIAAAVDAACAKLIDGLRDAGLPGPACGPAGP